MFLDFVSSMKLQYLLLYLSDQVVFKNNITLCNNMLMFL